MLSASAKRHCDTVNSTPTPTGDIKSATPTPTVNVVTPPSLPDRLNSTRMDKRKMMKRGNKEEATSTFMDMKSQRMDLNLILKDIEDMVPSHMTWKEKKALENKKVVSLGGKPPKKQRLPLSVARVQMKKQKERDQKMLQQNMILGQVGGKRGSRSKRESESRKPEDRVLMSTAGRFRNGILDVKDLLKTGAPSRDRGFSGSRGTGGLGLGDGGGNKKKGGGGGGKKKHGKKGGRRKGHH
ncbi:unnamed protein product [Lactuca virosa]|uniref:Ribosome biogenesis regulatory protein n=1 Tax=Lactuca virosa TaxID=75947 RepID=A0AAU9MZC4_9ASTR|nr:unnamed protein product [Lactuca virosa]